MATRVDSRGPGRQVARTYRTRPGERYPSGASPDAGGVNFSVFSRYATSVELRLYETALSPEPFQVIGLDPDINRTFFSWHVYVEGLPKGIHYTWRVDGPTDTRNTGFRFESEQELVDPYATAVTDYLWDRSRACRPDGRRGNSMRAVVPDEDNYDWEGDTPLHRLFENSIIYELHVGGFTRHPSSDVAYPGTFSGLIQKIPYLQALGITEVELMPVMAFDAQDVPEGTRRLGLKNYWGYSPHSFFAPHPGYCVSPASGTQRREFRDLVKALHQAGIGVILDVVFNHTAEAGPDGPIVNFKGLGNSTFYHLDPRDRRLYRDYTGCGNTINCNHPLVTRFLVECLEYWVREMHVDGFRFDLASVLARGEDGKPLYNAPAPWNIEFSSVLAHTTLIAEAWDAGGLYQVGAFPGFRWAEWNGRYRDVIRRFVRGDPGLVAEVATRVSGSSDLYQEAGRLPINSINFVTCHDGFTLWDLVSFNQKHNQANGESNRDGSDDNLSWNCGAEGDTADPAFLSLRMRQAKNFLAILLLSRGVPLLLAGDEVLRTQRGNNNAYCQDNALGWLDWSPTAATHEMLRFTRQMIAFRKRHPCLMQGRFLTGRRRAGHHLADVTWHGIRLNEPLWQDPGAQLLAFTLGAVDQEEEDLHVIFNMSSQRLNLPLPAVAHSIWHRAIDTGRPAPGEILPPSSQPPIRESLYAVRGRSVVVLEGRPRGL
jgi:isoamylase